VKIQHRRLANPFLCVLTITALLPLPSQAAQGYGGSVARFATFNVSLNRGTEGQLTADLAGGDNAQARAVAEIIQRTAPEVILLNEFDYDAAGAAVDAFRGQYTLRSPRTVSVPSATLMSSSHPRIPESRPDTT
jgi:hypothetical protein